MAIEKADLGISDADMFRSAMADEPQAEPDQAEPKADATGRLHGQDGKYVEKARDAEAAPIQQQAEPTAEPVQQTANDEEGKVPPWRHRELREQRNAEAERARKFERELQEERSRSQHLQRQLEQSQKPQEAPDWFANPDAAIEQRLTPLQQEMKDALSQQMLENSETRAMLRFGVKAVDEMKTALEGLPKGTPEWQALSVQMMNSRDPVGIAMSWYQRDRLIRETGGDITNYRTKLEGDLLKDPAFLAKALDAARAQAGQPGNPPKVQIPPSLNRASGSAGNGADDAGDMSDASLWAASRPTGRRK